jgi:DNA recombination-dependent growth factor C
MGIRSTSATFSRFYVPEPVTEDFWNFVDDQLRAGTFRQCENAQERSAGFSSWDDFFDSSFVYGNYHKGEYVAFHFRIDQRKVPPILLKQYVREEIQKYRDEHEGHWPPRSEKQQLKENVQAWLFGQALPMPSAYEVVWNPHKKWLLLGTTNGRVIDAFLEFFEKYFRIYPVPLYHVHWALNMLPLEGYQKDFMTSMVSPQSSGILHEGRFLGYEFLTWLWFFIEQSGGTFPLENQTMEVHLGERLILSHPEEGKERVICTTQAHSLHEARTALQQGKLVEELQVFLNMGEEEEYSLKLDTSLWIVKGLKTPKQMRGQDEEDEDGRFLEKMYFLEKVLLGLDGLYAHFLSKRLTSAWDSDTLPMIKEWISS